MVGHLFYDVGPKSVASVIYVMKWVRNLWLFSFFLIQKINIGENRHAITNYWKLLSKYIEGFDGE